MAIGPPAIPPLPYQSSSKPGFGAGLQSVYNTAMPQTTVVVSGLKDASSNPLTYEGYAYPGAFQAQPMWYISRAQQITLNSRVTTDTNWANGDVQGNLVFNSGLTKTYSGITAAHPPVVTVASTAGLPAFGYILGDTGMTQINNLVLAITIINSTTFSFNIDASGFSSANDDGLLYFPEYVRYTYQT